VILNLNFISCSSSTFNYNLIFNTMKTRV